MHDQLQSPFFAQLPAEIRSQIQVEYLADHLRAFAISNLDRIRRKRGGPDDTPDRIHYDPYPSDSLYSAPASPLSRTCRRMRNEMLHDQSPYGPARLAVFCVARHGDGLSYNRFSLAVEGHFDWDRVRRLRFVNEQDHPNQFYWKKRFGETITSAFQMALLEMEFSPRMSLVRMDMDEEILEKITQHPRLKTIKIRGNVPRLWIDALRTAGKEIAIEPIWWTERAPEEEEEMDRQQVESARKAQADLDEYYKLDKELKQTEQEEQKKPAKKRSRCKVQ